MLNNEELARNLIAKTFENGFEKAVFLNFVRNLIKKLDDSKAFHARGYVKERYKNIKQVIKTYERLGTYTDLENNKIDILVVYLVNDRTLDGARSTQRDFIADYLRQRDTKDAALVAFVSPNPDNWRFSLVKMEYRLDISGRKIKTKREITPARRFSFLVGKNEKSHTAQTQLVSIIQEDRNPSLNRLEEAFSVEPVTSEFFKEYCQIFFKLKENFYLQIRNKSHAHDFSHLLLNRIMFLYFIDKKRWLGADENFLKIFWETYKNNKADRNTFYSDWLSVLFFEAFNNKFSLKAYFPEKINNLLMTTPYLNGGLFNRHDLDSLPLIVPDDDFLLIYNFFNRYNFTIREDLPLDKEVAVDPEMIGKVYESLVNLSETSDERGDAGIFYTPRSEIDFMCRAALVEYFYKHLGPTPAKDDIYKLIFAKSEIEQEKSVERLKIAAVWPNLVEDSLDSLTIVDPAVGSGSFLVGMLNVLTELYKLVYKDIGRRINDFEIKKQIIGRSLYGVDVMEWAVHVCELRLWLQLVVEADIPLAERKTSPLLPNLTFKIRPGDSLVEEVGGVNLSMRGRGALNSTIKRKITMLKQAKYDYFYNNRSSKFYQSEEMLKQEEQLIFRMIIDERVTQIRNEISSLENHHKQETLALPGMEIKNDREQKDLFEEQNKRTAETKQSDIELLSEIRKNIKTKKPFVWDIDFVEIFADESEAGFDIVIGNPPYVRQEKIADPKFPKEKITTENKKEYKEKLTKSVEAHFPWVKNLDKKSDLYIYFFFHGLSLLNPIGTLCFITSNSWLDVGYGKDLQKFLLERTPIKAIFDNQVKRSFESADVNTVITLLGSPTTQENEYSDNKLRFVMFKKPFEEVININNLLTTENALQIISNDDFRVYPITQNDLLKDGWEYPENIEEPLNEIFNLSIGSYTGNKWGGKYLRAPDIYWKVIRKAGSKLTQLKTLADINRGLTTGADDWFYHDRNSLSKLHIEKQFLKPIITNPGDKNIKGINVETDCADKFVLIVGEDKDDLRNTNLLKWIIVGETQNFKGRGNTFSIPAKRPSVLNRKKWYEIQIHDPAPLLWIEVRKRRHLVLLNRPKYLVDRSFYEINPKNDVDSSLLCAVLNSTLIALFCEIVSNAPGGSGAGTQLTVFEAKKLIVPNLTAFSEHQKERIIKNLLRMEKRNIGPIYQDINEEDRKALDDVVFDALGLTLDERKEVYWAVCKLVKNRLEKAKSL